MIAAAQVKHPELGGICALSKKEIDIEDLLHEFYSHELRKQKVGSLTRDEQMLYLGTIVDDRPEYESMLPVALGEPHPDAMMVARRVAALKPIPIAWPEARHILAPDVGAYIPDSDPFVRSIVVDPAGCIQIAAEGGKRPTWDSHYVGFNRIIGPNGKPKIEGPEGGHGLTPGNRYVDGARCPLELHFSPQMMVRERFIYVAWYTSLVKLSRENWNLRDHIPLEPRAPATPWLTGPERKPRILPTITPDQNVIHIRDRVNV